MVIPSQKALEDALARCEHAGPTKNAKPAPPQEVRKLLKIIRDGKVRLPDVVSKHGARLLSSKGWRTLKPDELWLVHEQVCLACLDTGDVDEAKRIIQKLDKRFPNSLRVAVLKGALFECCEDFDQADEIYKAVLEENEAHQGAWKRRCCIAKAQGNTEKAIGMLKEYLDVFMTDPEAWEELASLYLSMSLLKQACFCYEELILIQPQNPNYHLKYADLLYSTASRENQHLLHEAIGYYSVVLDLTNGCSVHAMYGILSCAEAIKSQGRGQQCKLSKKEEELVEKATTKLIYLYENKQPELAQHVKGTILSSSS